MKASGWVVGALVAAGVVFTVKGGCLSSEDPPDVRLAARFDQMCEIARDNIQTPERGVRKLGRFLDKHTGDMFGAFGDTLAAIERIPDDAKHDKRAALARDRLHNPFIRCARDWMRFAEAVEADPKAAELVERFNERFGRTLEIILSGQRVDLLHLPEQLQLAR